MAEKKTTKKTTTKKNDEKVAEKATVIIQPDGTKVSHIFNDQFDQLALAMYEGTLSEEDKAKLSQADIDAMASYVRQGILQLDTKENGMQQLNETQKKIRHLWFKDAGEEETREKFLGKDRYDFWKTTGIEESPAYEPSPALRGEAEKIASTINIETNINVENEKEEDVKDDKEEKTMFNQTVNNQQTPNDQQQQNAQQPVQQEGGFFSDVCGTVKNFTDKWYGKLTIGAVAAGGTYYMCNRKVEDEDYSSAGDDATVEYGDNFF